MKRNIPVISTSVYEVCDVWGQTKKLYAWVIRRNDNMTECGEGYDTEYEALNFAIGVAEERIA